jgi:hypothetical protein
MTAPTRRAALGSILAAGAVASVPAAAAIASSAHADTELIALAAEIERLCSWGEVIYAKGVDPFQETFQSLLDDAVPAIRRDPAAWKEHSSKACAYSRDVGRDAAIKERDKLDDEADRLWARVMAIPAATPAGRAAKVRAFLVHVCVNDWRGPACDLDWDKEQARALLGQFSGMSEEELAAI